MSEEKKATGSSARWGRRDFLRLSAQAAGALGVVPEAISISRGATAATMDQGMSPAVHALVLTADTPWIISGKEPEPTQRALADLQRDWYKVFGHVPVILTALPASWDGSAIQFAPQAPAPSVGTSASALERESFTLQVQTVNGRAKVIGVSGADMRGAIYAIYAFSEHILGVDPWWYWVDKEPVCRNSIQVPEDFSLRGGFPTFKYRGWFINDEDLLSGFTPDPLRENVFSLEMLDRICETLLRLRGNMLVPATFPFADERCYELTSRRGLVVNLHHVEVVGLNVFRWPSEVAFSYSQHPEIMEQYWQECIDALKGKEVVWTVGYRGKNDRPFWQDEPGLDTPAARGNLITRAIAKQVELIRHAQPDASIVANMWFEGAKLYLDGFIEIPSGVTLVWTDDGAGTMRDGGEVRSGNGMYYHTMMLDGFANQLSEFVPPERIYHEMARFVRAGATEFFLVNVSDVRPVPLSTECAMKMAWDARAHLSQSDQSNQGAFLLEWAGRQFGPQAAPRIVDLYAEYFAIPGRRQKVALWEAVGAAPSTPADQGVKKDIPSAVSQGDCAPHRYLRELSEEALPVMQKGGPLPVRALEQAAFQLKFAASNRSEFSPLLVKAEELTATLAAERRDFYRAHLLTAIGINLHSNEMLEHYCRALQRFGEGDRVNTTLCLERALAATNALFTSLRPAEQGKWTGWYFGESLNGLEYSRERIRLALAAVRGEPPPPIRTPHSYTQFYQYQERFKDNFPLLYGRKAN